MATKMSAQRRLRYVERSVCVLGYRLKKDATSSQNMGRFGPGLVRPGRFDFILGVGQFSRKYESFRLWIGLALDHFILTVPRRYFCCGSLLLLVLAVRIYTLVQLLCE